MVNAKIFILVNNQEFRHVKTRRERMETSAIGTAYPITFGLRKQSDLVPREEIITKRII